MHQILDLVFKSAYLFNLNPANVCLPVQSQQLEHNSNMFTVTIKKLERRHCLHS